MKLGDFGIARVLKHTQELARSAVGTPYYLSPEICSAQSYNHKSDVWSLGVILYELVTGKKCFEATNINALVRKIMKGNMEPFPVTVSYNVQQLILWALQAKPAMRPSVAQMLMTPVLAPYVQAYLSKMKAKGQVVPCLEILGDTPVTAIPYSVGGGLPARRAGVPAAPACIPGIRDHAHPGPALAAPVRAIAPMPSRAPVSARPGQPGAPPVARPASAQPLGPQATPKQGLIALSNFQRAVSTARDEAAQEVARPGQAVPPPPRHGSAQATPSEVLGRPRARSEPHPALEPGSGAGGHVGIVHNQPVHVVAERRPVVVRASDAARSFAAAGGVVGPHVRSILPAAVAVDGGKAKVVEQRPVQAQKEPMPSEDEAASDDDDDEVDLGPEESEFPEDADSEYGDTPPTPQPKASPGAVVSRPGTPQATPQGYRPRSSTAGTDDEEIEAVDVLLQKADGLLPHGFPTEAYVRAAAKVATAGSLAVAREFLQLPNGPSRVAGGGTLAPTHIGKRDVREKALASPQVGGGGASSADGSSDSSSGGLWTGRYEINGQKVSIAGARKQDSPAFRIEALRTFLVRMLGQGAFTKMYDAVTRAIELNQSADLGRTVRKAVGKDRRDIVPLVVQLAVYEQREYDDYAA